MRKMLLLVAFIGMSMSITNAMEQLNNYKEMTIEQLLNNGGIKWSGIDVNAANENPQYRSCLFELYNRLLNGENFKNFALQEVWSDSLPRALLNSFQYVKEYEFEGNEIKLMTTKQYPTNHFLYVLAALTSINVSLPKGTTVSIIGLNSNDPKLEIDVEKSLLLNQWENYAHCININIDSVKWTKFIEKKIENTESTTQCMESTAQENKIEEVVLLNWVRGANEEWNSLQKSMNKCYVTDCCPQQNYKDKKDDDDDDNNQEEYKKED